MCLIYDRNEGVYMAYQLKLKVFEGPLDLLYHLIQENEIDIYDIPIHEITDQYMAYLQQMNSLDMEVTSEFLVMAATLMEIKSRMLLPNMGANIEEKEEVEDPRDILVAKLLEYKGFKIAAQELKQKESSQPTIFFKNQEDLSSFSKDLTTTDGPIMEEVDLCELRDIFEKILQQASHRDVLEYKPKPIYVEREVYQVSQQIKKIKRALRSSSKPLSFERFFMSLECRQEMVVTFLALLEMSHKGTIRISMNQQLMDAEIKEVT